MQPNRAPGIVWSLRKDTRGPYVSTVDGDAVQIVFPDPDGIALAYAFNLSRKDARLLAKRINQCLDYTRKK